MAQYDLDEVADLIAALRPFADFYVRGAPDSHVITQGSAMAQRQITMGDCHKAKAALERFSGEQA